MAQCTSLRVLGLEGLSGVSDRGVAQLASLKKLEQLTLERTPVGDEAMAAIANFPSLTFLDISSTNVTPAGLAHRARCRRLDTLGLHRNQLTSEALSKSASFPARKCLFIEELHREAASNVETIKHALPNCEITGDYNLDLSILFHQQLWIGGVPPYFLKFDEQGGSLRLCGIRLLNDQFKSRLVRQAPA